jgi:hypothetical protein
LDPDPNPDLIRKESKGERKEEKKKESLNYCLNRVYRLKNIFFKVFGFFKSLYETGVV